MSSYKLQQLCIAKLTLSHLKCKVATQKQRGPNDCALFAIAYAVVLCCENDPTMLWYYQHKMREHLFAIKENKTFAITIHLNQKCTRNTHVEVVISLESV